MPVLAHLEPKGIRLATPGNLCASTLNPSSIFLRVCLVSLLSHGEIDDLDDVV
eukprot:m.599048 g.599048  ORF g.599048 m.599048 type:complete len:53 (-) comp58076_c0_seq54:1227-1385(-)